MSKHKGKKSSQGNLSPENYIKTRARDLPIGRCYLNESWEESGFATIVVSRNHSNGNYTFGVFLVDVFCLGVKETFYYFNTYAEFNELLDKLKEQEAFVETEYAIVHNIIYGAIDYAESYGFKPHKDFEVSQYLLEEDDDRIELMDIEFGYNGKPAIFVGKEKHPTNIIATLERTAGKGNFTIITEEDLNYEDNSNESDFDEDDFDEDDFDEEELITENITAIFEGKKKCSPKNMTKLAFAMYKQGCTKKEIAEMDEIIDEVDTWEIVDEDEADDPVFSSVENESLYKLLHEKAVQNPNDTIPEIESRIAADPNEYYFHNLLAFAYDLLGDKEKEYETLVSTYQKFSNKIMAFVNYIVCQTGRNNFEELEKLIGSEFDIHQFFPHRHKLSFDEFLSLTGALFIYFSESLHELHKGAAYMIALTPFIFYGSNNEKLNQMYLLVSKLMLEEIDNRILSQKSRS
ncbi:MAG TPA: hypothetical protein VIJ95_15800 [Hanamia sp.]